MPTKSRHDAARMWAALLLLALLAIVFFGCDPYGSYGSMLRAQVSADDTCPTDRLVVRPLPRNVLQCTRRAPPSNVASDPGRLVVWNDRETSRLASCEEPQDFIVEACGHTEQRHCAITAAATRSGTALLCNRIPPEDAIKASFMRECVRQDEGFAPYCECAWTEYRRRFSAAEIADAANTTTAPFIDTLSKLKAATSCSARIPDDSVKATFVRGCAGNATGLTPFCDCAWGELRKRFSAAELADPSVRESAPFVDAQKALKRANSCGASMPEDWVRNLLVHQCLVEGRTTTYCDCAWTVARGVATPSDLHAGDVDWKAIQKKAAATCSR